jgi:hypothetical protein
MGWELPAPHRKGFTEEVFDFVHAANLPNFGENFAGKEKQDKDQEETRQDFKHELAPGDWLIGDRLTGDWVFDIWGWSHPERKFCAAETRSRRVRGL